MRLALLLNRRIADEPHSATIRAYGEDGKFLKQNERFINIENRAYYLTVRPDDCWLNFTCPSKCDVPAGREPEVAWIQVGYVRWSPHVSLVFAVPSPSFDVCTKRSGIVAFMGVGGRYTISPSETGLILSYALLRFYL